MKRVITSNINNTMSKVIRDSDWYRLINRIEKKTGMKVTPESRYDSERNYLILVDKDGYEYSVDINRKIVYEVDEKDLI